MRGAPARAASVPSDAQAVDLLEDIVRIESPSGGEDRVARFLAGRMESLGFAASVDEVGNVVGSIGSGPVHGVLLGHIDTVPGDLPVRRTGEVLTGRGSVDAKGPFVAFVAAAARVAASNIDALRLTVIGCVEEEAPSSRGALHVRPSHRPDFLVVGEPSGWSGITLGYKGYLRVAITLEEPTRHTAHQGESVGSRACLLWGRLREACAAIGAGRTRTFDQLTPTLVGIGTETDGRRDRARLDVSFRLPPELPPDQARRWLAEVASDATIDVIGTAPAWSGPRTTPLHRAFAHAIRHRGARPRYLLKTGTADLNHLAPVWQCPSLAYGPGDSALDHTPDEHIRIDEFLRGIAVLEDAVARCAVDLRDARG